MGKYGKGITVQGAGRDFYVWLVKERGGGEVLEIN